MVPKIIPLLAILTTASSLPEPQVNVNMNVKVNVDGGASNGTNGIDVNPSCKDINSKCLIWAAQGECKKSGVYNMCRSSCACVPPTTPSPIIPVSTPEPVLSKEPPTGCSEIDSTFEQGGQCFRIPDIGGNWDTASDACLDPGGPLEGRFQMAKPNDPIGLRQRIMNGVPNGGPGRNLWLGARGTKYAMEWLTSPVPILASDPLLLDGSYGAKQTNCLYLITEDRDPNKPYYVGRCDWRANLFPLCELK